RFGTSAGSITVRANNACGSGPAAALSISMPCRNGDINVLTSTPEASVFPNPSNNYFTLQTSSSEHENFSMKVFDVAGRLVESIPDFQNTSLLFGETLLP